MQKGNSLVEERWNGGENFADAAYPRKCSGGGFGEGAESSPQPATIRRIGPGEEKALSST
jgi:hypothetical protein